MLGIPAGRRALESIAQGIAWVIDFGHAGIAFVFGGLANPDLARSIPGWSFIFAINVLPQIIYLSALIAVLYHYNIMQVLARGIGMVLARLTGVSTIEAFSAATAMFLGQTEATDCHPPLSCAPEPQRTAVGHVQRHGLHFHVDAGGLFRAGRANGIPACRLLHGHARRAAVCKDTGAGPPRPGR
ncbi:Na+ dependent nucleoside transporter N-terminal domain-containing protein [Komagataeibacter rhaeticus]|nr:Na+ dependent nucleoside transporter N-terminal domain-containing protein [Komagataeibacter rhaeticus]